MKFDVRFRLSVAMLVVMLSIPAQTFAQQPHYKLVDLGTFGGPYSYVNFGSNLDFGQHIAAVNRGGTVVGFADTSASDPFPTFCFWDCFVAHTFLSDSSGKLTSLGALPGGGSSAPSWITANGFVAGVSENGETDPLYAGLPQMRAVVWFDDHIFDLKTLEGGYQSEANAVNSFGQAVGAALNKVRDDNSMQPGTFWLWGGISPTYPYQTRAFIWDQENGMQDLGTLGGTDAQALLINDRGQVVGHSYINSNPSSACAYPLVTRSFIWEKRTGMVDLGNLGGTCTLATDLNQRGQVVGSSNLKGDQSVAAFLWEGGQLHRLGGSLGGKCAGASAINEAGEAVGFGYLAGGDCIQGVNTTFHATLWKSVDEITDLGVLGSDLCSYAADINRQGQVVGSSGSNCFSESNVFTAFLWEKGTLFDLNSLIPADSPLFLQSVETINDRGEIAGQGVDSSGNDHAFLLIPCDENHPAVEGCDYSLVDVTEAALQNLASATHKPTFIRAGVLGRSLTGSMRIKRGTTMTASVDAVKVLPTITSFTPVSGPVGTSVTITGTGLKQTTKLTFGGVVATFVVNSSTQVTVTVPKDAVTGKIAVTTPGGSALSPAIFTVGNASVLDGYCVSGGLSCTANYNPAECRIGATPIDPGSVQCGFPIDPRANVDFGRSCDAGGGYCGRTGPTRRP